MLTNESQLVTRRNTAFIHVIGLHSTHLVIRSSVRERETQWLSESSHVPISDAKFRVRIRRTRKVKKKKD